MKMGEECNIVSSIIWQINKQMHTCIHVYYEYVYKWWKREIMNYELRLSAETCIYTWCSHAVHTHTHTHTHTYKQTQMTYDRHIMSFVIRPMVEGEETSRYSVWLMDIHATAFLWHQVRLRPVRLYVCEYMCVYIYVYVHVEIFHAGSL
jgi:hypothetical protein